MMRTKEEIKMSEKILNKKDVLNAWIKWQIFAENTHSYERMQAVAVTTAFGPALKKIYANNEEGYKRALQRHMVFFNTEGNWGGAVLGLALAMEESMAEADEDEKDEVINGVKTSLMGPMAGLGDSIDWGTLKPIICGIGLTFSLKGSFIGVLFSLLFCFSILFCGYECWFLGYNKGAEAVTNLFGSPIFAKISKAASLLGMFMMGVLTASYVSLSTTLVIPTGDSVLNIQEVLDSIIPGLLPLAAVLAIYFILHNKTQKFGLITISIVIICIVCSAIGVF